MKFKTANHILIRLKEGKNVAFDEEPEIIAFLEDRKLIEVLDQKVLLTTQGGIAAGMGIEDYLKYIKIENEILNFSLEKSRQKSRILLIVSILLFLLFFTALATNLSFLGIF